MAVNMKVKLFVNKIMWGQSRMASIALVAFAMTFNLTAAVNAQTDLKKLLAGTEGKTWQLSEVKASGKSFKNINFDENDAFAQESELAQLIPYLITFEPNGTCENTYVSQYDDGTVSDEDYTAPCEWYVEGKDIEIIEDANEDQDIDDSKDEVIRLIGVTIKGKELRTKFTIQGNYTGGVEALVFKNN